VIDEPGETLAPELGFALPFVVALPLGFALAPGLPLPLGLSLAAMGVGRTNGVGRGVAGPTLGVA